MTSYTLFVISIPIIAILGIIFYRKKLLKLLDIRCKEENKYMIMIPIAPRFDNNYNYYQF